MTFGVLAPVAAVAQDRDHRERGNRGDRDRGDRDRGDRGRADRGGDRGGERARTSDHRNDGNRASRGNWNGQRPDWRGDRRWDGPSRHISARPHPHYYRPHYLPRDRYYDRVRVYRPYGRPYPGFGFYYQDNDALRFLGLTALSFVVFNQLNESQQRAHEEAMIAATDARIGESIVWNEGGRSGSVTPVRDGMTADGRQCREFQQEVVIGGEKQDAYGTACLQPDGSWEVASE